MDLWENYIWMNFHSHIFELYLVIDQSEFFILCLHWIPLNSHCRIKKGRLHHIDLSPFSKIYSAFRSFLFEIHDYDSLHCSYKAFQLVLEIKNTHQICQVMAYIIIVKLLIQIWGLSPQRGLLIWKFLFFPWNSLCLWKHHIFFSCEFHLNISSSLKLADFCKCYLSCEVHLLWWLLFFIGMQFLVLFQFAWKLCIRLNPGCTIFINFLCFLSF